MSKEIKLLKRRELIKKLALSVPAGMIIPGMLSCSSEDGGNNSAFKGKGSVIGAGPSGLYIAYLLGNQGVNVEVFEAGATHGGRIKYLEGFSDFQKSTSIAANSQRRSEN